MAVKKEPSFLARYDKKKQKAQCLWEHLNNVSRMAGKYASKVALPKTGALIGIIHDLGKATEEFQEYLKFKAGIIDKMSFDLKGSTLDHSTAGAQVLSEKFLKDDGRPTLTSDILAIVSASHHGFMDALAPDGSNIFDRRLGKGESEARKDKALRALPTDILEKINHLGSSGIEKELENFLNRALRADFRKTEGYFTIGLMVRYLLSCLIDADRIDAADFDNKDNAGTRSHGKYVEWSLLTEKLEKYLKKFKIKHEIDHLRRRVSDNSYELASQKQGLFRLSVPTGTGKTLASLRFALHHAQKHSLDRILYVIPYTSIIDQNANSIREALGIDASDYGIVLEHHSNLTITKDENKINEISDDETQYRLLAENWDSPIVLTTMVQFLDTIYSCGTNNCRRFHQLANSVIIFDEIQTLSVNHIHLFNLALKFLLNACGTSILLCTATQPLLHKVKPVPRALPFDPKTEIKISQKQRKETLKRVEIINRVRPEGWNYQEIADLALGEHSKGKSVLVIVNTKRDALNIFKSLDIGRDYHLSTNMCPAHRCQKLKEITEKLDQKQAFILVSTQLIEAGVDVDFDIVIRSLAGLDSIAQAAGRCNRHGSKPYKGQVFLVNSSKENLSRLPDIDRGKKVTERILSELEADTDGYFQDNLLSEPALERYFKYYFYERSNEMDYPVSSNSPICRSDNLVELLGGNRKSVQALLRKKNQKFNHVLRQSFSTAAKAFQAIPHSGHGVIVPFEEGKEIINALTGSFEPQKQFKILRKAQIFSVNMFMHELQDLEKMGAIHEVKKESGIFYLNEQFYCKKIGWTLNKANPMKTLTG